jgi:hypothetical protein
MPGNAWRHYSREGNLEMALNEEPSSMISLGYAFHEQFDIRMITRYTLHNSRSGLKCTNLDFEIVL